MLYLFRLNPWKGYAFRNGLNGWNTPRGSGLVLLAIKGVVLAGRRTEAMVSYHTLPTFPQGLTRAILETPKGAAAKFTYEPTADVFEFGKSADHALTAIKKGQATFKRKHRARNRHVQ